MTKDQAIYILRNTAWLGSNEDRERTEEAVNMAIEALSSEKTQLSGEDATKDATFDTISRKQAIDALQKEINKGIPPFDDTMGAIRCGVRLARNIIEDLPSADIGEKQIKDYAKQYGYVVMDENLFRYMHGGNKV